MGRHSRRGPARPADAARGSSAAPAAAREGRGAAPAPPAGTGEPLDAEDSWSPWEPARRPERERPAPEPERGRPAPEQGPSGRTGVTHGRGGAPAPVGGGHPEEYGRPERQGPQTRAEREGPHPRPEWEGPQTWADQPRDRVGRAEGSAGYGQPAPYYDTLDDRGGHPRRPGPEGPRFVEDAGHPGGPGHGGFAHTPGGGDDGGDGDGELPPLPPEFRSARPVGPRRGVKGRLFTGALAVAVLVVLGVTVSEQVAADRSASATGAQAAGAPAGDAQKGQPLGATEPSPLPSAWNLDGLTYKQRMGLVYDLSPTLEGPGSFTAVPGTDEPPAADQDAPPRQEWTYRVDVEDELGLDGQLFADAVHRTLNDRRSWAHDGLAFKRVPAGGGKSPDFVITLASPGTTAEWCAKSGLDTTIDNVSCDSASTSRVMINAYRWARGSETYGDRRIHSYRQMLINHEVGHRLGYGHVECSQDGGLAPVMQQQTKFLDHDGIHCKPNAWAYPNG
ncbi:DUF3152 domain-containing protein [Streptomyces sp. NPDC047130]|uniref:DUF3152 domain-containing protein n=1 Tax=Streptomyces sp. NPDC047130 TaxID=3155261 RepID=UPI0033CF6822